MGDARLSAGFEREQYAGNYAYDGNDQIHPKRNPIQNGLTTSSVYPHLVAPSASHDLLSAVSLEQEPDKHDRQNKKEGCKHGPKLLIFLNFEALSRSAEPGPSISGCCMARQ